MQDQDDIQAAAELYRIAPAEFIAARDERARQARAAGDAALARSIMKLRRPAVSAWLVNLLARDFPGQLSELLELGEALREAQRALAGERLRELSERRRQVSGALIQQVRRIAAGADVALSAQAEREVAETLDAALADPDAARAVASGMLTRPLAHVGLGEVPEGAVIAFRPARQEKAQTARAAQAQAASETSVAAREAAKAERDLKDAREIASQARDTLDEAEQRLAGARDRQQAAQRQVSELERQIAEAQAEQAALARAVREAQRTRDTAARWLQQAHQRLTRVEGRTTRADPEP